MALAAGGIHYSETIEAGYSAKLPRSGKVDLPIDCLKGGATAQPLNGAARQVSPTIHLPMLM